MKKSKTIFKVIPVTPYSVKLWLLISSDPHFEILKLNQKYKNLEANWGPNDAASTESEFYDSNKLLVVFDPKWFTPDSVAHEVVHIKNMVFKHAGIIHDPENDEPEAYLVGWLTEEIHKAYLEYKKL